MTFSYWAIKGNTEDQAGKEGSWRLQKMSSDSIPQLLSGNNEDTITTPKPETEGLNREIYDPAYMPEDTLFGQEVQSTNRAATSLYLIKVGVFAEWENALQKMRELQADGMNAGYYIKDTELGRHYAVFTGMFRSEDDAKLFRDGKLDQNGEVMHGAGLELYPFEE